MKKNRLWLSLTFFAVLAFNLRFAQAEPLKDFLISSAYGAVAGALVGVASLALTDDPGSKMNNIARGASLGLYAGMGFGLYLAYENPNSTTSSVWVQPEWQRNQVDGLSLQTAFLRF